MGLFPLDFGDDKELDLVYQRLNIEGLQEPFPVPSNDLQANDRSQNKLLPTSNIP